MDFPGLMDKKDSQETIVEFVPVLKMVRKANVAQTEFLVLKDLLDFLETPALMGSPVDPV